MAAFRTTTSLIARELFWSSLPLARVRILHSSPSSLYFCGTTVRQISRISYSSVRCSTALESGETGKKASTPLSQVQQLLLEQISSYSSVRCSAASECDETGKKASMPLSQVQQLLLERISSYSSVRCSRASESGETGKKVLVSLSQVQQLLLEATERAKAAGNGPVPKITLDHVTVNFARSGGPGGQNVNKVNTKVDMRFNVKNAHWLSERVREKVIQMEKNRINKDGELVISSTKYRTQKGNIEDALEKLQAIIDVASYVPPPPSEEKVKKIAKLVAIGEQKRLQTKKQHSQKKAFRRNRDSWD